MSYVEPRYPTSEEHQIFIPRLTPQPPPSVAVDDPTDAVCVRINAAWVKHIAGYLYGLTRYDAWDGTEQEVLFARQQAMNLLSLLRKGSDCEGSSMSCEDVLNCLEDVPAWEQLNAPPSEITMSPAEIQTLSDEQHTERDTQYDGTPESILNDPVIDNTVQWFNNPAIEEAVTAWVVACFEAKLNQMRQIEGLSFIANLLLGLGVYLETGYWLVKFGGWSFLPVSTYATHGYDQLWDALQNEDNLRYTVGAILTSMNTNGYREVSFSNYQTITTRGDGNRWNFGDVSAIRQWMNDEIFSHQLTAEKNYLLLLSAIHTANHHKENLGDPMWRAWRDDWLMWRGRDYSLLGVQMLDGTKTQALGFVARDAGTQRYWDIVLTAEQPFQVDRLEFPSTTAYYGIRQCELTIKNNGVQTFQGIRQHPISPLIWSGLFNVQATSIRWRSIDWEAPNTPSYLPNVRLDGDGKPPIGFWTPD